MLAEVADGLQVVYQQVGVAMPLTPLTASSGLSSRSRTARLTKSRRCLSVRGVATCSRRISSAERMLVSNPEEELKRRFRFAIAGACCVA